MSCHCEPALVSLTLFRAPSIIGLSRVVVLKGAIRSDRCEEGDVRSSAYGRQTECSTNRRTEENGQKDDDAGIDSPCLEAGSEAKSLGEERRRTFVVG
jgi:hypothetical protein